MSDDLGQLPDDLPVPIDDGGADHLIGIKLPAISLPSTAGGLVNLAALTGRAVLYVFPMVGRPDVALPEDWNLTPGARGCTVQNLAYEDTLAFGANAFGVSNQPLDDLQEAADRLGLNQKLLSDEAGEFAAALSLPTLTGGGLTRLARVTLLIDRGEILRALYPVFPPGSDAEPAAAWLASDN